MKRNFNWMHFYFMMSIHLVPVYFANKAKYLKHYKFLISFTLLKYLAVTAGMHRLWTHKSYSANKLIKLILFVLCNSTGQSSIKEWTAIHRMHHRYEENRPEYDPYSIKKGFFWAHMGWVFFHSTKSFLKIQKKSGSRVSR